MTTDRLPTFDDLLVLFDQALDEASAHVLRAAKHDLLLPAPCTDWNLGALIGHMIGQNDGIAAAVREGDAPRTAYAPAEQLRAAEIAVRWSDSAARLRDAFGAAAPSRSVRLAELEPQVSVTTAPGMQLLDNAVHTWDIASALGDDYRPKNDIAQIVHRSARRITGRPGGTPGIFMPAGKVAGDDPWANALALLGRQPEGHRASSAPRPLVATSTACGLNIQVVEGSVTSGISRCLNPGHSTRGTCVQVAAWRRLSRIRVSRSIS